MPQPIRYQFSQHFNVPAREAYEWCTDYTPEDQALMQMKNATREVQRITEGNFMLTDTFHNQGESIVKQKLVCLYPDKLMWISTHVAGPVKHSQFVYEIKEETATTSSLEFTALHLDYEITEGTDKEKAKTLTKKLRKEDSDLWKHLAKEMKKELRRSK